jgi:hypothetical protein
MTDLTADGSRRDSIPALVAAALLAHDLPDSTPGERDAGRRYVDASVAAMPDVTRVGVGAASVAVYAALSVLGGRPFRRQSPVRQSELAARLAGVRLPILSEFNRLTRGLGLVGVFEARYAQPREDGPGESEAGHEVSAGAEAVGL